jgi:hypothetical protein
MDHNERGPGNSRVLVTDGDGRDANAFKLVYQHDG